MKDSLNKMVQSNQKSSAPKSEEKLLFKKNLRDNPFYLKNKEPKSSSHTAELAARELENQEMREQILNLGPLDNQSKKVFHFNN